ncbi:MAG TPA: hypothetical protein VGS96_17770 [Thermoanaerobaculia bacterium]|jgi:hypothetical protein|nr:hypothetical protein [Thermoanaerobaculia bacterium]
MALPPLARSFTRGAIGDGQQRRAQRLRLSGAEATKVTTLDSGENVSRMTQEVEASSRESDRLRTAIRRISCTLDVSTLLQVVESFADGGFADPDSLRHISRSSTLTG